MESRGFINAMRRVKHKRTLLYFRANKLRRVDALHFLNTKNMNSVRNRDRISNEEKVGFIKISRGNKFSILDRTIAIYF